ncbi:head maturation protease, ClpP-related [Ligilactobacillus sp.]|uniref:head maturation protease, ClpP-related n=1 Tax=Ligilactobacillus sp. TaxID=2767921 RepID=UPI002FE0DC56
MTAIEVKADIVDNDTGRFYDWIGWDAVYPGKVATLLDGADEVEVNINSNGGDVFAASEIYTLLAQHSGRVTVNIQGLAASAASVIAMAGDVVHISPTAQIMIHKAWTTADGNADDMAHTADFLEGIDDSIMNAYVAKTGLDKAELSNMMAKETWLTASQAVDYGFADDVMDFGKSREPVLNSAGYPQVSRAVVDRWKKTMASAEAYEKQKKTVENRDADVVGKKKLQAKIDLLF